MTKYFSFLIICCLMFSKNVSALVEATHFVFVIPSYNNEHWCIKNIESCVSQHYSNWSLIYIDDMSTDKTASIVQNYFRTHNLEDKCRLIQNKERRGALENIYNTVHQTPPDHVIVTVDGDDWLYDTHVLETLAKVYSDTNVWMTYGDFISSPAGWPSCGDYIPSKIAKNRKFRSYKWVSTHLRTFYAGLFQLIDIKDLTYKGKFFSMTWDMALMFPMLEMASKNHFRFIPQPLYVYNVANPLMDWRVNAQLQRDLDKYIRNMPPYKAIKKLF